MKYLKFIVVSSILVGWLLVPGLPPSTLAPCFPEHQLDQIGEGIVAAWPQMRDLLTAEHQEVHFDIPVVVNQRVKNFIDYYRTEAKLSFSTYLRRSTTYIEPMRKILAKHGLPQDLVYLALIESGFNPFAYSPAQAAGPWQFLAGTARIYGLRRDQWVDERRDPIKSTEAAAQYLKDLYEIFGDWYLVLAAYNTGQYRVQKAIREAQSRDYWALDLPAQTEEFVPRFLAAAMIAKNPENHGFTVDIEEYLYHDIVLVDGQTDLRSAANCLGYDVEVLRKLNPELRNDITPPQVTRYPLRIPKGAKHRFSTCHEEMVQNSQVDEQSQS